MVKKQMLFLITKASIKLVTGKHNTRLFSLVKTIFRKDYGGHTVIASSTLTEKLWKSAQELRSFQPKFIPACDKTQHSDNLEVKYRGTLLP